MRPFPSRWFILSVALRLTLAGAALAEVVPAGENLLPNGGFEEGEYGESKRPRGWYALGRVQGLEYRWSENEGREGSKCVFVRNAAERAGLCHKKLLIDPARAYVLSAWVRTKGLPDGKVWIRVAVGGKGIETKHHVIRVPASPQWQRFSTAFRDIDPKATTASVMVQMRENARGSAWVDDVFFGEGKVLPFVSEYPVPALAGSRPEKKREATLDTDKQRGESYKKMVFTGYNLPFVVGAHWFKWANGYGFGHNAGNDPRSCGLIDDWNRPYASIVKAIRETHEAIAKAGRKADFRIGDLPFKND
jgi:hypothetical protein